jgi:hypothetical protein
MSIRQRLAPIGFNASPPENKIQRIDDTIFGLSATRCKSKSNLPKRGTRKSAPFGKNGVSGMTNISGRDISIKRALNTEDKLLERTFPSRIWGTGE